MLNSLPQVLYFGQIKFLKFRCQEATPGTNGLRGKGGVPWVQIMENEFEYLADRGDHGGHLAEKVLKKYCS